MLFRNNCKLENTSRNLKRFYYQKYDAQYNEIVEPYNEHLKVNDLYDKVYHQNWINFHDAEIIIMEQNKDKLVLKLDAYLHNKEYRITFFGNIKMRLFGITKSGRGKIINNKIKKFDYLTEELDKENGRIEYAIELMPQIIWPKKRPHPILVIECDDFKAEEIVRNQTSA